MTHERENESPLLECTPLNGWWRLKWDPLTPQELFRHSRCSDLSTFCSVQPSVYQILVRHLLLVEIFCPVEGRERVATHGAVHLGLRVLNKRPICA